MKFILLITLTLSLFSCASRDEGWLKNDAKIVLSAKEFSSLKKQTNKTWNKRHVKLELEKTIDGLKKLARSAEKPYPYLAKLSRAYYFLADYHYDDIEMKMKYWEIGTGYGEKAMATNAKFAAAMKEKEDVSDSLQYLDKSHVSAVYWSAVNLGKWGKAQGLTTILRYKGQIKDMIQFVEKQNPKFYAGAAYRYWGVYFAVAPGFAGGDLDKSKKFFQKAMTEYPGYLATNVLYARYYTIKKSLKSEFRSILNRVKDTKVVKNEFYSENLMETKKAIKFLKEEDELF